MHLNKLIRSRRLELGMSQMKLSKLLGYREPYFLSNIERGRSVFPKGKLKRLRRALLLDERVLIDVLLRDYSVNIYRHLGVGVSIENTSKTIQKL